MIPSTTTSNICSEPGSPRQSTQTGQQQLNFYKQTSSTFNSANSDDFKVSEMTVIKSTEKLGKTTEKSKSLPGLHSYEVNRILANSQIL